MTRIATCEECGRLFPFLARGICGDCLERLERDFRAVRDHLREQPRARIPEVARATGVAEEVIYRFLREGRLEQVAPDDVLACEVCGAAITAGRHCAPCRERLLQGLRDAGAPRAAHGRPGMHSRSRG
jgi:predicted amidophosphoribosyltransferase